MIQTPGQPDVTLACPAVRRAGRRFRPDEEDGVIEVEGEIK